MHLMRMHRLGADENLILAAVVVLESALEARQNIKEKTVATVAMIVTVARPLRVHHHVDPGQGGRLSRSGKGNTRRKKKGVLS